MIKLHVQIYVAMKMKKSKFHFQTVNTVDEKGQHFGFYLICFEPNQHVYLEK